MFDSTNNLEDNFLEIQDYFNQGYEALYNDKDEWRRYVLLNPAFRELHASNNTNIAFLTILFGYFERVFPDIACCLEIYNKLKDANVIIGNRLEAAALFLFVSDNLYFINRYDEIITKLQIAYCNEEDVPENAIITFLNYFKKVLTDPPPNNNIFIRQLKDKIYESRATNNYLFLNHPSIDELLNIDLSNIETAYDELQHLTDSLIASLETPRFERIQEYLIEENTDYSSELEMVNLIFKEIRDISIRHSNSIINKDAVHTSLGRGAVIINNEDQLFYYIRSFGNMHEAKLRDALDYLDTGTINNNIELIDWGCGQGIATMVFLEKFPDLKENILRFILTEPSEICLKRASLHLKKYFEQANIITINKDFDSLNQNDVITDINNLKIHLFSNILDIETFNISQLINLISETQKGENIFLCVSPYIDITKTERIHSFVRYFQDNYPENFRLIVSETVSKNDGYWNCSYNYNNGCTCFKHITNGCGSQWTKIIKIFKITIN